MLSLELLGDLQGSVSRCGEGGGRLPGVPRDPVPGGLRRLLVGYRRRALGLTQDNCELSMRQMSSISRCGESRWKQMECDLAKGIKCDSTGSPVMDPTCEAILDSCAFIACTSGGSGDGSCWAGCDDWGAKCEAGGKSCECTGGKNIGKKFTLSTPCDEQAMELTCSL